MSDKGSDHRKRLESEWLLVQAADNDVAKLLQAEKIIDSLIQLDAKDGGKKISWLESRAQIRGKLAAQLILGSSDWSMKAANDWIALARAVESDANHCHFALTKASVIYEENDRYLTAI